MPPASLYPVAIRNVFKLAINIQRIRMRKNWRQFGSKQNGLVKFIKFLFPATVLATLWFALRAGGSGTSPTLQIVEQTNRMFAFTWNATKGQTHLVMYSTNLLQTNWSILTGVIVSNNTAVTGFDAIAPFPYNRFYRLWILSTNSSDVTKPTVAITAPAANQLWSNAVFLVKGTAADNKQVVAVLYQINSNNWSGAFTTNKWTNWTASVMLIPGTNTVKAFAVDTNANVSTTNGVSFRYVVSAPLQVQMTGRGTLSPNDSNAVLAIGQSYSMTATPGTGFMFTNWTGGTGLPLVVLTNKAALQFVMQSNLTLQANFVDTNKPTVSITNLVSGQRVSNAVFTVKGTATDNWMVSNVWYQLNSGGWNNATGTTNWSAILDLTPGTNILMACAVDTTGNKSTTNSVSFQYVVSAPLQVRMTGRGTLSPNDSNAVLAVGQSYNMTATPGTGFMFTNWTGGTGLPLVVLTNKAALQFVMQSNLTLQANFVDTNKPP